MNYISHVIYCTLSGPSCEAEGKGSVTYGLGADISLPPCLSERPGICKLSLLRLKSTSGPKSRGASSRYSALARRPEVPSPGPPFLRCAHAHELHRPMSRKSVVVCELRCRCPILRRSAQCVEILWNFASFRRTTRCMIELSRTPKSRTCNWKN